MAKQNVLETNKKKEFQVSFELSEVLIFCGFYSSLVIFSLWITVTDKVGMLQKDISSK